LRALQKPEWVIVGVIAVLVMVVVFVRTGPGDRRAGAGVNRGVQGEGGEGGEGARQRGPRRTGSPSRRTGAGSMAPSVQPRKRAFSRETTSAAEGRTEEGARAPGAAETTLPVGELMADPDNPARLDAIMHVLEQSSKTDRYRLLRELGRALAAYGEASVEVFEKVAGKLGEDSDLRVLLRSYFRGLGEAHPALGVALASEVENRFRMHSTRASVEEFGRRIALREVVSGWAAVDPDAAAKWVSEGASRSDRASLISGVLSSWVTSDAARATDWAIALSKAGSSDYALRLAASLWSNRDLDGALDYLSRMEPGAYRDVVATGLMSAAARRDPDKAFAILDSVSPGETWERAAVNLAQGLAREHPEATAAWVRDNLSGHRQVSALATAVNVWAARDAKAAAAFLSTLPDEALQDRLFSIAAASLAYKSPGDAYSFVMEIENAGIRDQALESVVRNWSARDPAGAADWAAGLRSAEQKQTAYTNIALQWGRRDKEAAAEWLRSLPDEPAKYGAIVAYAAANVTFPDRKTLNQWRTAMGAKDLSKAEAVIWIQKADLPASVRDELMYLVR